MRLALDCLRLEMLKPKSAARPSNFFTAFCAAALDGHVAETHVQRVAGREPQSCRSCGSDETIGGPPPRISAPSRGRFLLAYFVFPLEQRCSIENGSAVTRQRFDNLVRKMSSCGRFAVS